MKKNWTIKDSRMFWEDNGLEIVFSPAGVVDVRPQGETAGFLETGDIGEVTFISPEVPDYANDYARYLTRKITCKYRTGGGEVMSHSNGISMPEINLPEQAWLPGAIFAVEKKREDLRRNAEIINIKTRGKPRKNIYPRMLLSTPTRDWKITKVTKKWSGEKGRETDIVGVAIQPFLRL